jgi:hypothetical protein
MASVSAGEHFIIPNRRSLEPMKLCSEDLSSVPDDSVKIRSYEHNKTDVCDCSQCAVDCKSVRSLPERTADGPMGPTYHSHTVHCPLCCQLAHPGLRDSPRRHPHSKNHGRLRVWTHHWTHAGLHLPLLLCSRSCKA